MACLGRLGFALDHPQLGDLPQLLSGLEEFRQHLGGRLTLTMLRGVGQPIDVHDIDRDLMGEAVKQVRQYYHGIKDYHVGRNKPAQFRQLIAATQTNAGTAEACSGLQK